MVKVLHGVDRIAVPDIRGTERRPGGLWLLLLVMALLAVAGFFGGISFVADPTGVLLRARLSWLDKAPVSDFLLPGLFLLGIFGIGTTVLIGGLCWRFSPGVLRVLDRRIGFHWSWAGTIVVGLVLVSWIVYEFAIIADRIMLQPILIGAGVVMMAVPLLPSMRNYYRTNEDGRGRMLAEDRTETRRAFVTDRHRSSMLPVGEVLSWAVFGLMVTSGILTIAVRDLFAAESPWGREAFRGGELISLVVAAPLLAGGLITMRRGSIRAQVLWIGTLLYAVYNYAYAVFGATFNDAFLVHIGAFSASVFAIAFAVPALDRGAIAAAFRTSKPAKGVGMFLVVVGVAQGLLWLFVLVRNAITGEVLHDIPVSGQHLVFGLDLGLLVPSLILAGILLARRRPFGFLFGTAVAVMGAVYQLNLMMAGIYGAAADVPGVKALAPESVGLTTAFVIAALLMLLSGRRRSPSGRAQAGRSRR